MADPANIETIQARLHLEAIQSVRCMVLQRFLAEFDPRTSDLDRTYLELLHRAQTAIAAALEAEGESSDVP